MSPFEPDLQRIFASLGEGVWQRDLATGRSWHSPRYKQLLGFADAELADDDAGFAQRGHPDDQAAIAYLRDRALATFEPCTADGRMRTRTGEWRWFRATLRTWPDAAGRPAVLCGSLTDVHVEKQAIAEAKEFAERFDRALDASSEAHFERTAGSDGFFMSPRIATLLGHPRATPGPSSQTFWSWVHPEDRPALRAVLRRTGQQPGMWELDCRLRCADESYRWFGGRGRSERDSRGRLRMTGMLGDIHASKTAQIELARHREQLEQMVEERTAMLSAALELAESRRAAAERANLAKATFLAHMSHELRTPLNGVMGLNQLAARSATSETQRRYLHLAEESGRTLLRILEDVLDFAKAEAGKLRLVAEPFDVPALVAETVRGLTPQIGTRPIHMLFDNRGDLTHASGDPGRVRQIVSNLVGNALKFTESGAIEVVVTMAAQSPTATRAQIVVRDTGPGMDEATLQRVFEAFEQGDSGLARRHGGTGLGLTIVRQLTQLMGGRVDVDSAHGRGTTFSVELLLGAAGQPATQPAGGAPGHAWLLYVSPVAAGWVQQRLSAIGWSAQVFGTREALLARLAESPVLPDCVVIADEMLADPTALATLRAGLPPQVPLSLVLRSDFRVPALRDAPPLQGVHMALAPMTRRDLGALVRPPAALQPAEEITQPVPLGAASPKVLLVEDTEMNRLIVVEMLRVLGMRVDIAESGEDALAVCREAAPDLVLMDIQMPGMDGLEATRRLRALQRREALPRFPIVALTANAMDSDRIASRAAGIDEHVAKPVDVQQLRAVLSRWLPGLQAPA